MPAPSLNCSLPRHAAVAHAIREEIAAGTWQPGAKIPSIRLLTERYGVSVASVRRALEKLVEANILIGMQGKGVFVRSFEHSGYWNRFHRFQRKDGSLITEFEDELSGFEMVQATNDLARELGVEPGTWLVHWSRSMCFDGKFSGFDQAWLPRDLVPNLKPEHFIKRRRNQSIYAIYEESDRLFITSSSDRIQAIVNGQGSIWDVPLEDGIPLLVVQRTSLDISRRIFEFRVQTADARFVQICTD